MIIRWLEHYLPPREGGKEVIINHPNSLLHKEGSHAPVICDNSHFSVGSTCPIPLPMSEAAFTTLPYAGGDHPPQHKLPGSNQGAPSQQSLGHFGETGPRTTSLNAHICNL